MKTQTIYSRQLYIDCLSSALSYFRDNRGKYILLDAEAQKEINKIVAQWRQQAYSILDTTHVKEYHVDAWIAWLEHELKYFNKKNGIAWLDNSRSYTDKERDQMADCEVNKMKWFRNAFPLHMREVSVISKMIDITNFEVI